MPHDIPSFNVKLSEAAEALGFCYHTIWRMCKENRIPHIRIGRSYRLNADDLRDLVSR